MTKALHVYRTYFPDPTGGLQEAIRQISLSTKACGVDNTVFTLSPHPTPSVLMQPEARVVRCRSWAAPASCDIGGRAAFSCFARLARESDIVHYLFPWPFADVLHATVQPDRPTVLTYISDVVRQRWLTVRPMRVQAPFFLTHPSATRFVLFHSGLMNIRIPTPAMTEYLSE